MKKVILSFALLLLVLSIPVFVLARGEIGLFDTMAEPCLISPITEEVDLRGKDFLEFKWMSYASEVMKRRNYEFKLYEGYNMYEDGLMDKELLPKNVYSIKIDAKKFENDKVYTWALKQIAMDGRKGDLSYSSFKVIK
ncbi:MAG: hypothetical protein ABIH18_01675 [Candidatus Omnitrophota bacterium]